MNAVAPLAYSQLLTHRDLSYSMAKVIAETAIDSCAAKGYAVSAVVVDRAGDVIVAMRAGSAGAAAVAAASLTAAARGALPDGRSGRRDGPSPIEQRDVLLT